MTIKPANKLACLQQMQSMLAAGIPITRTLELLCHSQADTTLKKILHQVKTDLLDGNTIYHSVKSQSELFSPLTAQLIHLGEQTGKLNQCMTAIVQHHQSEMELRSKLIHTLTYPCVLVITAFLMTICMFTFVIPQFAELFSSADKPLPLLTQLIFTVGYMFQQFLPYFLITACLLLLVTFITGKQRKIQQVLTHTTLQLPALKRYHQQLAVTRFARHLAMSIEAGLPLLRAIELITAACNHPDISQHAPRIRADISSGMYLHQAMQSATAFPPMLLQMIKTGEDAGSLPAMLTHAADIMQSQLEARLKHFLQLFEPLIILGLGVLIGGLVAGMYLPIFNLGSAL